MAGNKRIAFFISDGTGITAGSLGGLLSHFGETEFEHVMKKMLPNNGGTYVGTMDAGEVVNLDFTYSFNGDYILPPDATAPVNHGTNHTVEDFNDLGVVVWIQRNTTKEVYQSTYALAGTASVSAITATTPVYRVYPNPANAQTTLAFQHAEAQNGIVQVMDYAGKVVLTEAVNLQAGVLNNVTLTTAGLAEGCYLVALTTASGTYTEKLMVRH